MIDNGLPYTGFTPQDKKVCIRCLGPNDNPLQQLCYECRRGDELSEYFTPEHQELLLTDIGDAKREAKFGVGL